MHIKPAVKPRIVQNMVRYCLHLLKSFLLKSGYLFTAEPTENTEIDCFLFRNLSALGALCGTNTNCYIYYIIDRISGIESILRTVVIKTTEATKEASLSYLADNIIAITAEGIAA